MTMAKIGGGSKSSSIILEDRNVNLFQILAEAQIESESEREIQNEWESSEVEIHQPKIEGNFPEKGFFKNVVRQLLTFFSLKLCPSKN